jgi:hypothetical protein
LGVEVEIGGKAVLGGDIDIGSGLSGFEKAGLPLLGMSQIAGGNAEDGEDDVGGVAIDRSCGNSFGQLGQRGVDRVHRVKRRQVELEALAAGTGLGHAEAAGAVTKVVDAVALSGDGEGLADAAGVVDMRANV